VALVWGYVECFREDKKISFIKALYKFLLKINKWQSRVGKHKALKRLSTSDSIFLRKEVAEVLVNTKSVGFEEVRNKLIIDFLHNRN
jgi:site-specific recombinase XerD